MPNGLPLVLGTFNTASLTTSLTATTIPGGQQAAFIAFGPRPGVGVLGRALALGPNLIGPEIGVAGDSPTTGVFGQSAGGMLLDDDGSVIVAGAGHSLRVGQTVWADWHFD